MRDKKISTQLYFLAVLNLFRVFSKFSALRLLEDTSLPFCNMCVAVGSPDSILAEHNSAPRLQKGLEPLYGKEPASCMPYPEFQVVRFGSIG